MQKSLEKKIEQIINLNKERREGNWGFCYYYHLGQFYGIQNDNNEILFQATGQNDGDEGLQCLDEDMKEFGSHFGKLPTPSIVINIKV